jgi:hypothetical protein
VLGLDSESGIVPVTPRMCACPLYKSELGCSLVCASVEQNANCPGLVQSCEVTNPTYNFSPNVHATNWPLQC